MINIDAGKQPPERVSTYKNQLQKLSGGLTIRLSHCQKAIVKPWPIVRPAAKAS